MRRARARRRRGGRAPHRLSQHPRRRCGVAQRVPRARRARAERVLLAGQGADDGAARADGARPRRDRGATRCARRRARARGLARARRRERSSSRSTPATWCARIAARARPTRATRTAARARRPGVAPAPRARRARGGAARRRDAARRARSLAVAFAFAALCELLPSPPLTRAMLERARARRPRRPGARVRARSASSSRRSTRRCGAAARSRVAGADAKPRAAARRRALRRARAALARHARVLRLPLHADRRRRRGPERRLATCSTCSRASVERWLALMVPYSVLLPARRHDVLWRVVNWFNARVPYASSCRCAPAPTSSRS